MLCIGFPWQLIYLYNCAAILSTVSLKSEKNVGSTKLDLFQFIDFLVRLSSRSKYSLITIPVAQTFPGSTLPQHDWDFLTLMTERHSHCKTTDAQTRQRTDMVGIQMLHVWTTAKFAENFRSDQIQNGQDTGAVLTNNNSFLKDLLFQLRPKRDKPFITRSINGTVPFNIGKAGRKSKGWHV